MRVEIKHSKWKIGTERLAHRFNSMSCADGRNQSFGQRCSLAELAVVPKVRDVMEGQLLPL
jgi:hypothetical protein